MPKRKKQEPVTLGHYHEALDRTYIVFQILDKVIMQHPVYSEEREFKYLIDKASTDLWEAYQIAGSLMHEVAHVREKKNQKSTKRRTKGAA